MHFSPVQSVVILVLVFLSMALNFGFLLMAMDRLRNEVADLALLDDLTGVGNRRHLVQRLTEECARSERSGQPFALLVIDLDGFKAINDTHGHAAGDACLQHFTLMAQTRLRPGDMLARTGGDEFCIVLPSSTLREGAMIARRVLEVCRADAEQCVGIGYSDRGLDRRRAMDPRDGRIPRPPDRRRRPRAVRRQEGRPQRLCDLRSGPAAGARPRNAGAVGYGPAQARVSVLLRTRHRVLQHESSIACDGALGPRISRSSTCANARSRRDRAVVGHARDSRPEDGLAGAMGRARKIPSLAQHHRAPDRRAGRLRARRRAGAVEEPDPARRHGLGRNRRHGVLGGRRTSVPTHGDGANRNDNKYIDNRPTYRQVVGNNSIGVEFAGNYPDVTRGPTEAQVAAWRILVKVLRARYGIPLERVYAHNWIDYKDARYCEGCALAKMAREWGE